MAGSRLHRDASLLDAGVQYAPDTTAAIFWLKNRRPADWRDKREVDLGVQDSLGDFLAALDGRNKGVPGPEAP